MKKFRWLAVLLALTLLAAACGSDDNNNASTDTTDTTGATTTTGSGDIFGGDTTGTDGGDDACADVTTEATEIGISADTITVQVMADVGSPLAPGLFQGSLDGMNAWVENVNANGGLACRTVVLEEFDSQVNPQETSNGILRACDNAFAMVGSTSLFLTDVTDLDSCPDLAGAPTGIPDIPERAVDAHHQCSPNVFTVSSTSGSCPYSGEGPRDWQFATGQFQWLLDNVTTDLHGIYLLAGDLRGTIQVGMPTIKGQEELGWVSDGFFAVGGSDDQSTYTQYLQAMKTAGSNFAGTGSNDQTMLKLRREAIVQGVEAEVWSCGISCYTPEYLDADTQVTEGTYLWLPFLPFDETDTNEELASFIDAIGTPQPASWSAGSWAAGVLFEQAVNQIVEADGPNALTRARLLEELANIGTFDANGMIAALDPAAKVTSPCFVVGQIQAGKFARLHPEEPGTFDCDAEVLTIAAYDALADFDANS